MDEERKKILIGRVSKLLAKAQSTNFEAEAHAFLAKAQEVLADNGLTMAEIDALTEQEQRDLVTSSEPYLTGNLAKVADWVADLSIVIARNFRCRVYYGSAYNKQTYRYNRTVVFMGVGDDTRVARDVFATAVAVADRLSKDYVKNADWQDRAIMGQHLETWRRQSWDWDGQRADKARISRQLRLAFLGGFIRGLHALFEEQKKAMPGMALVLVIHPLVNERYETEVTGKPRKRTTDYKGPAAARAAGFAAGKSFTPTTSPPSSGRLAGPR